MSFLRHMSIPMRGGITSTFSTWTTTTVSCAACGSTFTFKLPWHQQASQNLVASNLNKLICYRQFQMKAGKKKTFIALHERDKVTKDFDLIYVSSLRHYLNNTRIGLVCIAICMTGMNLSEIYQKISNHESLLNYRGFILCITPFIVLTMYGILNTLARPFVTRIYHNPETARFIAVRRNFLLQLKQIDYTLKEVSVKEERIAFNEKGETYDCATVDIRDISVFLNSTNFISQQFYNIHVHSRV